MGSFYPYLVSSLPTLLWPGALPFSYEKFLQRCRGLVSEKEQQVLESLPSWTVSDLGEKKMGDVLEGWQLHETALRNELVSVRSSRKKIDPAKYVRRPVYAEPGVTHLALSAYRNPSLLEGEKTLDQARWRFLDELSLGHYFDFSLLCVYALKLLILERWENFGASDKEKLLEEVLTLRKS